MVAKAGSPMTRCFATTIRGTPRPGTYWTLGVIPKQNRPNNWRLIVDLSSPEGHSVNDELD